MRVKNAIVIIGGEHHNTLGMLRCIGMAGLDADIIILGAHSSFISKSKYINSLHHQTSLDGLIDLLRSLYAGERLNPVLFTCSDSAESFLDNHYDDLKNSFAFFNAGKQSMITGLMNKQTQIQLAVNVGLEVPYSIEFNGIVDGILYPCIVKPVESIKGGKQVEICKDESELKEVLLHFDKNNKVQIQQLLEKEKEIVVLGVSVNEEIVIRGFIDKQREHDGGTLYSTVRPIEDLNDGLVDSCKALIKECGYEGLFGIEFIQNKGHYYYIETNFRNDATTYALACAGVNLPLIYYLAKTGQDYSNEKNKKVRVVNSIVEWNDFKHRKENNVPLLLWIRDFFGAKCKYYWNWKDPLPFFFAPFK